jgi:hypothetical protein
MIKYLMLGIWIVALALGSAYGTIVMTGSGDGGDKTAEAQLPPEQVRTKRLSVPIIGDGKVKGYVLAQFIFNINAQASKDMAIRPDIFLVDEAFKVIFSGEAINFSVLEKPDGAKLTEAIKKNINARFGENFLQDVLVQELNFVPQERFRGGALQGGARFGEAPASPSPARLLAA